MSTQEIPKGPLTTSLEQTVSAISSSLLEPQSFIRMGIVLAQGVLGTFAIPLEMILIPDFGSQYINPIRWLGSFVAIQVVVAISIFYKLGEMVFMPKNHGFFGMGSFLLFYYALSIIHIVRIAHLMRNPQLENDSMADGTGLPFLATIFKGLTWFRQRVVVEPLLALTVTIVLYETHVIDTFTAMFLAFAAGCYSLKSLANAYDSWLYIRDALDQAYRARILADARFERMMPRTLGGKVLASIPDTADRAFVARAIFGFKETPKAPTPTVDADTTAGPNGYAHLVTPVETGEQTNAE